MEGELNIAWIEYGEKSAGDGVAFLSGMCGNKIRARNLLNLLKRRKENYDWARNRRLDAGHPYLPIYPIGGQLMIRPNEMIKKKDENVDFNSEPLYKMFRDKYGTNDFLIMIDEQNRFLSRWLFAPGVKEYESIHLTFEDKPTASAKIIGVSGHGTNMTVYGGAGQPMDLRRSLMNWVITGTINRPSPCYIIVATCNNLRDGLVQDWLKAFRQPYPIRGVLGYLSYPGEPIGQRIFKVFCAAAARGKPILQAWQEANNGNLSHRWAAAIHKDAIEDTISDLRSDMKPLSNDQDILYCYIEQGKTKPTINPMEEPDLPTRLIVRFIIDGKTIDNDFDTNNTELGLTPGKKVNIYIGSSTPSFKKGEVVRLIFNLHRPDHENMDILKLFDRNKFSFRSEKHGRAKYYPNNNLFAEDTDDTIVYICPNDCSEFEIELMVHPEAHKFYEAVNLIGQPPRLSYGYFWIHTMRDIYQNLKPEHWSRVLEFENGSIPFVRYGVYLFGIEK